MVGEVVGDRIVDRIVTHTLAPGIHGYIVTTTTRLGTEARSAFVPSHRVTSVSGLLD